MLNLSAIFSVLYLYVEQFVHVGLPFVHRGIEKIKYSVILSTYNSTNTQVGMGMENYQSQLSTAFVSGNVDFR